MKAMFINGSPRKNWNTHKVLEAAMRGAEEAGAQTELVHLYDLSFSGCRSCFACKVKGAELGGVCAVRDDLRPVLERMAEADALFIGSPVYFGNLTAMTLALFERMIFPLYMYKTDDEGRPVVRLPKRRRVGLMLTMNVREDMLDRFGYREKFDGITNGWLNSLGSADIMYVCDTYQFTDYSKYESSIFDAAHKAEQRDRQFPADLENAAAFGRKICSQVI